VAERPRLLDAFCGGGGSSMGFHQAGFDVTGVDCVHQPRYPFRFVLGDALEYVAAYGHEYDAVAASPPCQRYSSATRATGRPEAHPDLVGETRRLLAAAGRPYVIENVVGAPLLRSVLLCGTMFGLGVFRHRLFESSIALFAPPHGRHRGRVGDGRFFTAAGRGGKQRAARTGLLRGHVHRGTAADWRTAMGCPWMTRDELSQAVPPAYTYHVGLQLRRYLEDAPGA
jgi:DNA (cytosine-5)-methyltransferase 1